MTAVHYPIVLLVRSGSPEATQLLKCTSGQNHDGGQRIKYRPSAEFGLTFSLHLFLSCSPFKTKQHIGTKVHFFMRRWLAYFAQIWPS